jgi:hypothetical protein
MFQWPKVAAMICITLMSVIGMGMLASCSVNDNPSREDVPQKADLVVYGKIFTSEGNNKMAEAFAVKDGKYVYVGDKKGAEAYIEHGKTEVVDYSGKGLVMPGCGNGHSHYSTAVVLFSVGTFIELDDDPDKFLNEIVPEAVEEARETGAKVIIGLGWCLKTFQDNMPTRQQLDAICSDIPMYFMDDEAHKGLANTIALVNAGIMNEDGTVGKTEIRGGEIVMGEDGTPTGFLKEQAGTYTRSFLDNESLFPVDIAKAGIPEIEQLLLSEGYTMYLDGWANYFYNTSFYKAAQQLDQAGELHFVLGLSYEIESWMDLDDAMAKAADAKKYASTRVKPNWIKLFIDGTVETGTGYVDPLYPDGHQGIANWTEEEMTELASKANANGLTLHVHTLGNKATNIVINAFINGGQEEMRNTLVHVYNVDESDYQRMADHNIYVTSGVIWHHYTDDMQEYLRTIVPANMIDKSYPMKSFFDYGIPVSYTQTIQERAVVLTTRSASWRLPSRGYLTPRMALLGGQRSSSPVSRPSSL